MAQLVINGIETNYEISEDGTIFSKSKNRILTGTRTIQGRRVQLTAGDSRRTYYIHTLVAETFIPIPSNINTERARVEHINGDKEDNSVENLQDISYIDAAADRKSNGTKEIYQYTKNGVYVATFNSIVEASKSFGVSPSALSKAVKRNGVSAGFKWSFEKL